MSEPYDEAAATKLRLLYGMTDIRQDEENGTWWIGSELRPDLLNLDSLQDAVDYIERLPPGMVDTWSRPRGDTGNEGT